MTCDVTWCGNSHQIRDLRMDISAPGGLLATLTGYVGGLSGDFPATDPRK